MASSDRKSYQMPAVAVLLGVLGWFLVTVVIAIIAELIHAGSGFGLGSLWPLVAIIIWGPIWYGQLHRWYGSERVAAFEAHKATQEAKYRRWVFAYLVPAVALMGVIVGLLDVGPGWRAAHGQGVPGTFTVTRQECRKGCMTYGDFTNADGSDTRRGIQLIEGGSSPRRGTGTNVPALDTDDRLGVYPIGTTNWKSTLVTTLIATAYLVGWLIWLGRRYMRRHHNRRATNLP